MDPIPDLTLRISPPIPINSAPSSTCNSNSEQESCFDLLKSNSEGSVRPADSLAYTDLLSSLTNVSPTIAVEVESPWERSSLVRVRQQNPDQELTQYQYLQHQSSKMGSWYSSLCSSLFPSPSSSSSCSCSSSLIPPSMERGWELNYSPCSKVHEVGGGMGFHGFSGDLPKPTLNQYPQFGMGASGASSHAIIRSGFTTKFPTKRSMRAPRMRWTTSLHARFIRAVDHLGGHESMAFI